MNLILDRLSYRLSKGLTRPLLCRLFALILLASLNASLTYADGEGSYPNLTDLPPPILRKIQTFLSTRDDVNLVQASTQSNTLFHSNLTSKYTHLSPKKVRPALESIHSYHRYLEIRKLGLFDLSELALDLKDEQGWNESKKFLSDLVLRRDTHSLTLFPRAFTGLEVRSKEATYQLSSHRDERLARGWKNLDRLVVRIPCELSEGLERELLWAEALLRHNRHTLSSVHIVVQPSLKLQPSIPDEQAERARAVFSQFLSSVQNLTHLSELTLETLEAAGPGGLGRGGPLRGLWSPWFQLANYVKIGPDAPATQLKSLILKSFPFDGNEALLALLKTAQNSLERVELISRSNDHMVTLDDPLASTLAAMPCLKHLGLEHFHTTALAPEAAAGLRPEQSHSAFRKLHALTQLESLSIKTWIGIDMGSTAEISELLLPLIRKNPGLRSLLISELHLNAYLSQAPNGVPNLLEGEESEAIQLWNATFANLHHLEVLILKSNWLSRQAVSRALPAIALLPSLRSLDLSYNGDLSFFPEIPVRLLQKGDPFPSLLELKLVTSGVFDSPHDGRALRFEDSILTWFQSAPLRAVVLADSHPFLRDNTKGHQAFLTHFLGSHRSSLQSLALPATHDPLEDLLKSILSAQQADTFIHDRKGSLKELILSTGSAQPLNLSSRPDLRAGLEELFQGALESIDWRGIRLTQADARELVALIPSGFSSVRLTIAATRNRKADKDCIVDLRRELAQKRVLQVDLTLAN